MIVGLGNVGREYEATRHNVGFMVVDETARRFKKKFVPGKGEYYLAKASHIADDLVIVKPTTYMNDSGIAVEAATRSYGVSAEDLLVVCDDFNLPLGKLRLRKGGSDGGHNGLYSIIYHLNDDSFPRLRCGIGRTGGNPEEPHRRGEDMADFVLSSFDAEEIPQVEKMVQSAADAVFAFVAKGIGAAMNKFN